MTRRRLGLATTLALGAAALASIGLWIASMGKMHFLASVHEPRWAFSIGTGRLKVWWARAGAFPAPDDWWPAMVYRGLDGKTIRWGFEAHFYDVRVVAVPLWAVGLAFGGGAAGVFRLSRRARPGHCRCGYSLAGLANGAACPECGAQRL